MTQGSLDGNSHLKGLQVRAMFAVSTWEAERKERVGQRRCQRNPKHYSTEGALSSGSAVSGALLFMRMLSLNIPK
eukprot:176389-Amphidinium_carterae.2